MKGFRSAPFLFLLSVPLLLSGQPAVEIDWKYEIDLLGRELAARHCNLFFKTDSATFFNALEQVKKVAPQHSLFEISVRLQQVIAAMGDAQTRINYHFNIDSNRILPLECYWFEEGMVVLQSSAHHGEILGKRITSINGYPLDRIVDSLATLLVVDNPFLLKSQIPRMITWTPLLEFFGFGDRDEYVLGYDDDQRAQKNIVIRLPEEEGEVVTLQPEKVPLGWQDNKSYFHDRYIPGDRIYYIQYNKCWSRESEEAFGTGASALFMPSFKEFEKQVFKTIKKEQIDKLVFDIRFNGGGNALQGTALIKKLAKACYRGKGDFFLVIGRQTFSSAMVNAMDFMGDTNAVSVGEGTGGRPNYYGEVERFVLPESKLVVSHSTQYFRLMEQDPPTMMPEILAPIYFRQYMNGIDPAFEAIRAHPAD